MATHSKIKIKAFTQFTRLPRPLLRATLAVWLWHSAAAIVAAAEAPWPSMAIPDGLQTFAMGDEVVVNGVPLRMRGLVSALAPAQVAAQFRASLGQPLSSTTQGARLVLGRALGEFYATVQLEPAGSGTRGVIAVSRLGAALSGRNTDHAITQRQLTRFPAGSRLLSRVSSIDGLQRADALALSNGLNVELNVRHLQQTLSAEGYQLQRTTPSATLSRSLLHPRPGSDTTLFFTRPGAQAIAVLRRNASGNTDIVLNTVTDLEQTK